MSEHSIITLETASDILRFDGRSAQLLSLRSRSAPDQEFVSPGDAPVFIIQYLDGHRRFRQITSVQAAQMSVEGKQSTGGATLTARYAQLAGLDLAVTVTVRAAPDDRFSHWSLTLCNGADLEITDVQFPFVVAPYHLAGSRGSEAVLWPQSHGVFLRAPRPEHLAPDCPHTWQMRPENGSHDHYPGHIFAQFLAYYNDRAGIYLSCQDAAGHIKILRPVHREPGLRLGISHVGDWPRHGERQLEYDIVLGSFTGDWYAAADLYRDWALRQPWARTPLHARHDIPGWLLDSPPHIILRIQGELDLGPVVPNEGFLPYPKIIPLLEALSRRIESPVVPVIMSWERPGPWIYPDCFPPAGGADSLREFTRLARQRGWHVGTFCNGTRWVTGHYWSGYEGEDYLHEQGGERSICRTHAGELWRDGDGGWRPSYSCCVGSDTTREVAARFVRTLLELGLDWIQFFDQNVGCSTFPCFATDHGHPPLPGHWMTDEMQRLRDTLKHLAAEAEEMSGHQRQIAFSVERAPNECCLPDFAICDVRVAPPGHTYFGHEMVPLFHYLYHEFVLIQGGFGFGADPYHLPIRNAYNLVVGEIPGAVMKDGGALLNLNTENWAPWDIRMGSQDEALQQLRAAIALRRGPAGPFLVYGRMLAPARVEGVRTMRWQEDGRDWQVPAVFHGAWQSPDGRLGLVLANWTADSQAVRVADPRLGVEVVAHTSARTLESEVCHIESGGTPLTLPPCSCVLLEAHVQGGIL